MGMPNAEGREGRDVGTPMQRVQQVRAEGTSSCKCVRSASVECNDRWTKPRDSDEFVFRMPNVRAKREPTVGRQAREMDDSPRRFAGLVACRWRSA